MWTETGQSSKVMENRIKRKLEYNDVNIKDEWVGKQGVRGEMGLSVSLVGT